MSVLTTDVRAERSSTAATSFLSSAACFWLMIAVYLLAHVVLRLWDTPNIGKNDVQEALAAQSWAWGYHPRNPPLHTWLLMSSYAIFGVHPIAHVILKYALLGATYGFAYLSARRLLTSPAMAALSALALTLLTPFAWTVHTALTHTLLLAAVNFATLWAALRLTQERRLVDYAAFGVAIGLGLLAKYSYALFFVPLVAAMLTQADLRRALASPRILISVAIAALLFAPHAIWMATARFDFVTFLAEKQHSETPQPHLADLGSGLSALLVGALSFLGVLFIAGAMLYAGAHKRRALEASPWAKATTLALLFAVGLLVLDVFFLRATQFEERYFLCAMLLSPLVLFQWSERRGYDTPHLRWVAASVLAVSIIAGGGLIGRAALWHQTCDRCWNEMPMTAFDGAIRSAGFTNGTILTDHYNVGGNMRINFPASRTIAANYELAPPLVSASGQCLLVWNARVAGDPMPSSLATYLARTGLTPEGAPTYAEALMRRSRERMDRFAYWVVPNADGNCRPL